MHKKDAENIRAYVEVLYAQMSKLEYDDLLARAVECQARCELLFSDLNNREIEDEVIRLKRVRHAQIHGTFKERLTGWWENYVSQDASVAFLKKLEESQNPNGHLLTEFRTAFPVWRTTDLGRNRSVWSAIKALPKVFFP